MAWYRAGGGGIPSAIKTDMNAVLNKKFGTSQDYSPTDWAPSVNLMGPLPEKTASGSVASITDGADGVPLKNWLVTLPASLDGYSEVNGVKSGANLFNEDWEVGGINDTTGLPNSDTNKIRSKTFSIIKGGTTCYVSVPQPIRVLFYASDESFISETANIRNNTFTVPSNCSLFKIRGTVDYGTSYNNDIMISYGTTATAYEAYISPTTYTASLGRTIYGGSVDVVNGTGTDGAQKIKIGDLDWMYQSANTRFYTASLTSAIAKPATNGELAPFLYSDVLSPLSFTAAQNVDKSICVATSGNIFIKDTTFTDKTTFLQHYGDTYIIVGKATPEDFTFTPISPTPETALGVNNFWADEGDSDVTYRADIDLLLGGN